MTKRFFILNIKGRSMQPAEDSVKTKVLNGRGYLRQ
jgi:hypothetical protein